MSTTLSDVTADLFAALGFPAVTAEPPAAEPSPAVTAAVAVGDGLDEVRAVLAESSISGTRIDLPAKTLPSAVWKAVHATLTGMGAKGGSRRGQPYRFDTDRGADLAAFIAGGPAPLHERATLGWVRTPDALAVDVVRRFAELDRIPRVAGHTGCDCCARVRVLEPSAGDGSLIKALHEVVPSGSLDVLAVEANGERAAALDDDMRARGWAVPVHHRTFEDYADWYQPTRLRRYDLVVMNPPYAVSPGNKTIWIDHVLMAWQLLADGGRLVAILPGGIRQRRDRKTTAMLAELGAGVQIEKLPAGSFRQSGTDITTCVLAVTKQTAAARARAQTILNRSDRSLYQPARGEPVRVAEPSLTARDVTERPVQLYHGFGGETVIRYAGVCIGCASLTWTDGSNDPRGAMGLQAVHTLRAEEHDRQGPDVCLCAGCAQTGTMWNRGFDKARKLWTEPVAEPEPAEDLLTLLAAYTAGLVDDVEHVVSGEDPHQHLSWGTLTGGVTPTKVKWSDPHPL